MLNYAVSCGSLPSNPIAAVKLLRKPNVRRSVLDDAAFDKLLAAAESQLKPIILVAYDTGMRLREVLGLRWSQVNLKLGVIKLSAEDTKTEEPRTVFLTKRVRETLEVQPRHIKSDWVFTNPATEEAWKDIRKTFRRACKTAKLAGIWFHDLRRSFVTNARRRGVPESVVMKMSGHPTGRRASPLMSSVLPSSWRSWESMWVNATTHECPRVWTRSGQSLRPTVVPRASTSSSLRATMVLNRWEGMRPTHSRATLRRKPRGSSSSGSAANSRLRVGGR